MIVPETIPSNHLFILIPLDFLPLHYFVVEYSLIGNFFDDTVGDGNHLGSG